MGVPYSKEIEATLNQLQKAKYVASWILVQQILTMLLQILAVLLLALILLTIIALLITINPDLADERRALVTPTTKWLVHGLVKRRRSQPARMARSE
jgi:hypothetical protein